MPSFQFLFDVGCESPGLDAAEFLVREGARIVGPDTPTIEGADRYRRASLCPVRALACR